MQLQELDIIDHTIQNTRNLRKKLKERLSRNQSQGTDQRCVEWRENFKNKMTLLKIANIKIREELYEMKLTLPNFIDIVPGEYRHFLRQMKKPPIPKSRQHKTQIQNKQNLTQYNKPPRIEKIKEIHEKKLIDITPTTNLPTTDSLKSRIYRQLEELRGMERKQNTLRIMNQSNKSSRVSGSVTKRTIEECKQIESKITEKGIDGISSETTSDMNGSNISMGITSQIAQEGSLYCPAKHQYYSGRLRNGLPSGNGRLKKCCEKIPYKLKQGVEFYNGGFLNGLFDGFGTLGIQNGIKFVGVFKKGKREGEGSMYYCGKVQIGRWRQDQFISNI